MTRTTHCAAQRYTNKWESVYSWHLASKGACAILFASLNNMNIDNMIYFWLKAKCRDQSGIKISAYLGLAVPKSQHAVRDQIFWSLVHAWYRNITWTISFDGWVRHSFIIQIQANAVDFARRRQTHLPLAKEQHPNCVITCVTDHKSVPSQENHSATN